MPSAEDPQNADSHCPWIGCSQQVSEWSKPSHDGHHIDTLIRSWPNSTSCHWPGCSSKATFKTPSSIQTHVKNIHVKPLVCEEPQCSYKKPFGRQCDLDRHCNNAHKLSRDFCCPVGGCHANTNGYSRKDKMLQHVREKHDNLKCPFSHCSATVVETEKDSHFENFHGVYECALGSCQHGLKSCFRRDDLRRHLKSCHNITSDPAWTLMMKVERTDDKTVRGSLRQKWRDCSSCSVGEDGQV